MSSPSWKKSSDPATESETKSFLFKIRTFFEKSTYTTLNTIVGGRTIFPKLFPPPSLNFYDVKAFPKVKGLVAITIDDCFCRKDEENDCYVQEIVSLLKNSKSGSTISQKVTFFTTVDFAAGEWREKLIKEQVLKNGHELGNHAVADTTHEKDTIEEFEKVVDTTNEFITRMVGSETNEENNSTTSKNISSSTSTKWFRAPSGKLSPNMLKVLEKKKMINVMGDCYANDPHITDPAWLAQTLSKNATDGSILIIHMPERGFREWCFEELKLLLNELDKKGLRSVTLTELERAAIASG